LGKVGGLPGTVEPAGIEPATSCLQRAHDRDQLRARWRFSGEAEDAVAYVRPSYELRAACARLLV
jgi:hypothetical protein